MNSRIKKITVLVFAAIIFVIPSVTRASTMYFETSLATTSVGDTIFIHAMLDTDKQEINAIDGLITIQGLENATLKDIRIDGSSFALWPEKPSFTLRNGGVRFSGGSPVKLSGDNLKVFDLVFEITNTNSLGIIGNSVNTYLADGKGTAQKVSVEPAKLASMRRVGYVPLDQASQLTAKDDTPPSSFDIEFGRDENTYDGKIFISFLAVDDESGIDYYEVKEGNRNFVRSGSPYILQGQDITEYVAVKAYDRAGNVRLSEVNESPIVLLTIILVIIAMAIIATIFITTFRKK
jgi:hypothetical protein